jgi:3-deoxy-7-phosphoheptulonate synthase
VAGRQDLLAGKPLAYGQSITDGCIGWEDTVRALELLAESVRERRRLQAGFDGDETPEDATRH